MVRSLINRFKEFRRPKKPRSSTTEKKGVVSRTGKAPGIIKSVKQPILLPGEDGVSYERHTKALQAEFKKTNRNNALVLDLMERSFAMRRMEILEKNYSLTALLSRFPFLQEADEVCNY